MRSGCFSGEAAARLSDGEHHEDHETQAAIGSGREKEPQWRECNHGGRRQHPFAAHVADHAQSNRVWPMRYKTGPPRITAARRPRESLGVRDTISSPTARR